jgi:hypothetical protein
MTDPKGAQEGGGEMLGIASFTTMRSKDKCVYKKEKM